MFPFFAALLIQQRDMHLPHECDMYKLQNILQKTSHHIIIFFA